MANAQDQAFAELATSLGVLHFYWQVKADTYWPIVAASVLALLLLMRVRLTSSKDL